MTATAPFSQGIAPAPANRQVAWLRAGVCWLHLLVVTLAVLSLLTQRFDLWIDLRLLGPAAIVLQLIWVGSVLLIPLCAGPRLGGLFGQSHWVHQGLAPEWALKLLWPTYLVIACLVANTVYFCGLWWQRRADGEIPLPFMIAFLLGLWALLTREWIRRASRLAPVEKTAHRTRLRAILLATFCTALMAGSFLIHVYARPPQGPVDLAVVLGTRIRRDGSASVQITDRVLIAVDLYNRGLVRHILLSGANNPPRRKGDADQNEIAAMKRVCLDQGIPEAALSLDPVGVNTRATAFNVRAFMQQNGYHTVVACSTDFHLFRTAMAFHEVGIDPYTLPSRPVQWCCANVGDTLRDLLGIIVYAIDPHYREPKAISMQLTAPHIVVRKSAGAVELFDGSALVKTYACITGGASGDKAVEGDRKTPLGSFHIVYKNPESKFHLSLGIDYPNKEDAQRGLASGLIKQQQYDDILAALASDLTLAENQKKLWYTPLGGEIFFHGHAEGRTGTAGCIALSNPDIEELYALLPLGTPVEIQP